MYKYFIGVIIGAGVAIGILAGIEPIEDGSVLRHFQKKGVPKVQQLKHRLRRDSLFIEYPDNSREYILLNDYLKKIPNKEKRIVEESKIKKLVNW